jgi:hypothetical protein
MLEVVDSALAEELAQFTETEAESLVQRLIEAWKNEQLKCVSSGHWGSIGFIDFAV